MGQGQPGECGTGGENRAPKGVEYEEDDDEENVADEKGRKVDRLIARAETEDARIRTATAAHGFLL